ncbi:MAG: hypothetical protein ACFFDF_04585 [Candidatus Odinarchaeota archaeon]
MENIVKDYKSKISKLKDILLKKMANNPKLTKKLSLILEFYSLSEQYDELKQEKKATEKRIISRVEAKFENMLITAEKVYINDPYLYLKCLNIGISELINASFMFINGMVAHIEAMPTPAGPFSESYIEEELKPRYYDNGFLPLLYKLKPEFQDDKIVVNYSDLDLYGIENVTYQIKIPISSKQKKEPKEPKILKITGEDLEIEILNNSQFMTILRALNICIREIYITIKPERLSFAAMNKSSEFVIGIKVPSSSFNTFYCNKTYEFRLDWEKVKPIIESIQEDNEIECIIKDNKIKIIANKDFINEIIIEPDNYIDIVSSLLKTKYNTQIQLEPEELLPVFDFVNFLPSKLVIEFNIYKELTGNLECSITAANLKYFNHLIITKPKIKPIEFQDLTQSAHYIDNFIFLKEIILIVKNLKISLKDYHPLRLDVEIKGGHCLLQVISSASYELPEDHDKYEMFYRQIYDLLLEILTHEWQDIKSIKKNVEEDADEPFLEARLNELGKKGKVEFKYIDKKKLFRKRQFLRL